ncbi:alpha/beta fold hydrolase [Caulobacter segnis]|uniref:alpha/beta fold hydrolase n=1 Tax=Caulobacter segnis TaxID=88688 RepID=UPI001CBD4BD6|nr:alpha/beta fold hydrolase [Caulobacter segnis]UAL09668.1 alpha/beta fold hydrolase [Caulobacter segnis]
MDPTRRTVMGGLAAASVSLAAAEPGVPAADRELRVPVKGGGLYVRVNGELNGPRPPLLCVHGGPGGALWQLFPALPLAKDRAVVLYDQLDSGRSDAPGDPANWTVDRFASEITAIRQALGIQRLHLLGHSWGGIVANRYAAGRPAGLNSLILQGAPLSDRGLKVSVDSLYAALPDGQGRILASGSPDDPAYALALKAFMRKHLARTSVRDVGMPYMAATPEDRGDALAMALTGGRIDGFDGVLKGFDDEPLLGRVAAPTQLLFGEFDIMTRAAETRLVGRLARGSLKEIPDAGHMIQFDQPDAWRAAVSAFLRANEA